MTGAELAVLLDRALDDCRIRLGPRTRAAFVARVAELLELEVEPPDDDDLQAGIW